MSKSREKAVKEPAYTSPPPLDALEYKTCDWGECNVDAVNWRWSSTHGWLPVCRFHKL